MIHIRQQTPHGKSFTKPENFLQIILIFEYNFDVQGKMLHPLFINNARRQKYTSELSELNVMFLYSPKLTFGDRYEQFNYVSRAQIAGVAVKLHGPHWMRGRHLGGHVVMWVGRTAHASPWNPQAMQEQFHSHRQWWTVIDRCVKG